MDIAFEIGTEEQSASTNCLDEFEYSLNKITSFCSKNKLPLPFFVVAQTGTKVMEMKNIGSFECPVRVENEIPAEIQLPKVLEICKKFNVHMKEHNADYLSNESLYWSKIGIQPNVAPEFGVTESIAFLEILQLNNLTKWQMSLLNYHMNLEMGEMDNEKFKGQYKRKGINNVIIFFHLKILLLLKKKLQKSYKKRHRFG